MDDYWLRFVYAALAGGGIAVLFARQVAHWTDQDPWVIRVVGYGLLALGVVGIAALVSPVTALKIAGVAAVICPTMAWMDIVAERKEAQMAQERMDKFIRKRSRQPRA